MCCQQKYFSFTMAKENLMKLRYFNSLLGGGGDMLTEFTVRELSKVNLSVLVFFMG